MRLHQHQSLLFILLLFILSILLSSYLIYNTKEKIDRDAIQQLAIIANLSDYITSSRRKEKNQKSGPHFHWVLRDFFLKLDKTPLEYLQNCLKLEAKHDDNKNIKEANGIRKSIQTAFKTLDCTFLPTPIQNGLNGLSLQETLQNLDKLELQVLEKNFLDEFEKLQKNMMKNIEVKSAYGVPLKGVAYAEYLREIISQLNTNERVNFESSMLTSINYFVYFTIQQGVEKYSTSMSHLVSKGTITNDTEFFYHHELCYQESIKILTDNLGEQNEQTVQCFMDFEKFVNILRESFQKEVKMVNILVAENCRRSEEILMVKNQIIRDLQMQLIEKENRINKLIYIRSRSRNDSDSDSDSDSD